MPALGIWAASNLMLPPELPDERAQAEAALRKFARSSGAGSAPDVLLLDGPIVPEILRVAREWPADVIVMGTHGASGLNRLMLGSVTERLLRRTSVPVLTRSSAAADDLSPRFKTILCAFDRSPAAARALDYAAAIARQAPAQLVVLHVVEHVIDEDDEFAAHFDSDACYREIAPRLRAWYARRIDGLTHGMDCDVELRTGKAAPHVLNVAAERNADLIVVGTAGESALFGSTAPRVVRGAHVPVLVVPPHTAGEGEPS